MCAKFYPDRLRFGSMRAKNRFGVKTEQPRLCLAVNNQIYIAPYGRNFRDAIDLYMYF